MAIVASVTPAGVEAQAADEEAGGYILVGRYGHGRRIAIPILPEMVPDAAEMARCIEILGRFDLSDSEFTGAADAFRIATDELASRRAHLANQAAVLKARAASEASSGEAKRIARVNEALEKHAREIGIFNAAVAESRLEREELDELRAGRDRAARRWQDSGCHRHVYPETAIKKAGIQAITRTETDLR